MVTILVADDRADVRRLLRRMLESPHRVVEAANGHEAFALLHASSPELAILDVDMPHATGVALCRQIRAAPQLVSMKVIIMTASGVEDETSARLVGVDGFLPKPFRMDQLLALVDAMIPPGSG